MAHLNFFGIDNFRAFKELNRFEFKPITVLVGTNSSGKSSISKGILCLKSSFEKIRFKSATKGSQVSQIEMHDTEKLHFKSYLNLGNFETCINKNSGKKEISFELPMKFPLLEDLFIVRFIYEKENNALKSGIQKGIQIFHLETGIQILDHSNENGNLKVNFSFLKEKLEESINKVSMIHSLEHEIDKIKSKFRDNEGYFQYGNMTTEAKEQIIELNNRQKDIFLSYTEFLDEFSYNTIDSDSLSSSFLYESSIHEPLRYNPKFPLFNYAFIFENDFLKINQTKFEKSEIRFTDRVSFEEFLAKKNNVYNEKIFGDNFIKKSIEIRNILLDKIKNTNISVSEYLKEIEITSLDAITFSSVGIDKSDSTISHYLLFWYSINKIVDLGTNLDLFESLINKENLYETFLQENLFLKPVKDLVPNNLSFFIKEFIHDGIGRGLDNIGDIYKSTHYIPSVRTKVDRIFRVGNNDSYFQEVLFQFHNTKLNDVAQVFIDKYLKEFDIADRIDLVLSSDSDNTKIFLEKNGSKSELADLGYGISQVLPIILKIGLLISDSEPNGFHHYYRSSIIIIEEPETNLHPALQSKLADMFVECYQKYNIQFIIETHSEYLIRKLQYLTAKKTIKPSDSVIYYFNHPDNVPIGEKQVKKIEILDDGSLSDEFGPGFFDEAANWELELLRLKNLKNRQN